VPNLELHRALGRLAADVLNDIGPAAGPVGEPIGHVTTLDGEAYAVRVDGTRAALELGAPIYQGDALETGGGAGVGIAFVDGTTFTMGGDATMVVDQFVYDPDGASAMSVDLVQGLFIYVSGEVAHSDPEAASLTTPVATIGIRGTAIAVQAGPAGTDNLVSLLIAPDDTLGQVIVTTQAGSAVLDEVNETTLVADANEAPSDGYFLSEQQIVQLYGVPLLLSPYQGTLQDGGGID
jgi:hypothetical protein